MSVALPELLGLEEDWKRLENSFWISKYEINRNPPTDKIKLSLE
jgi:hypothetical protein